MNEPPVSTWSASSSRPPPPGGERPVAPPQPPFAPGPAGFWIRLLAYWVDAFILGAVQMSLLVGLAVAFGVAGALSDGRKGVDAVMMSLLALVWLTTLVGTWLYFALMESSARQATLGKSLLGLVVTDLSGARIGFGRATGRFFAKVLSALPADLGFVAAAFTERKRALHDYVAGTVVERRRPAGAGAIAAGVAVLFFLGTATLGVLAAIAVPNFMKYQLRGRSAEASTMLRSLAAAEAAYLEREGTYLELEVPAEGEPGSSRLPWNPDDLAAAEALGWGVRPPTYFTYRVVVARSDDGRSAYSACAEGDVDGDGEVAAWVVFQPLMGAEGIEVEPPDPPCVFDPVTERPPVYQAGDPIGVPFKLSPENVF